MPRNIFLTGPRNVGKTTLLNKVLLELAEVPGGFFVTREEDEEKVIFFMNDYLTGDSYEMAIISFGFPPQITEDIFDVTGVAILEKAMANSSLIIMDELGFMEEKSLSFQQMVHKVLDSEKLVIGILKEYDGNFLQSIKIREDVSIIRVTKRNRDDLVNRICDEIMR